MSSYEMLFLRPAVKLLEHLCWVKGCSANKEPGSHLCTKHRTQAIEALSEGLVIDPILHLKRNMETPAGLCWVYFVGCRQANMVKIGMSTRLKSRMSALRHSSPIPIKLFKVFLTRPDVETLLHQHFKEARRHGEWFEITEELNNTMEMLGRGESPDFLPADTFPSNGDLVRRHYGMAS